MLFLLENEFVEILRETCYKEVLTICSDNLELVQRLANTGGTMAEPVELHNASHKWAIHVPEDRMNSLISFTQQREVEKVDRLTAPALAFAYDYLPLSESEKDDGKRYGEYGYCWPEEIEATRDSLMNREDPADSEVIFVPIWTLPADLTGAPRVWADLDSDDDDSDDLESD
jgi:hypothetical protein